MGGFWRVDIFCESGKAYGLGHFYRALKLASLFANNPKIQSITIHNRGDYTPKCDTSKYEIRHYEWLSTMPQMLDFAIIDSYEAEAWFYHRVSKHAKVLLCLDDTFRDVYPPSSYILNPALDATLPLSSYYPLHAQTQLLCGIEYMLPLLDTPPMCLDTYSESSPSNAPINVFVSFGGVDRANLTQHFIDRLLSHTPLEMPMCFHIVLGGGYPHTLNAPSCLDSIKLYHNLSPSDFLSLAKSCHLALCAGGGGMLELLALGIPSVVIEAASNQSHQIQYFATLGAIKQADNMTHALTLLSQMREGIAFETIKHTLKNLHFGSHLKKVLWHIIDDKLEASLTPQSHPLTAIDFCDIDTAQSELILSMRNHAKVASYMYATHITRPMHEQFLNTLKSDKSRKYWLLQSLDSEILESNTQSTYLGVGSLTRINLAHSHAFLGIYASPFSPLPKKGSQILNFLESYAFHTLALHTLHLEVMEDNIRAREFYHRHGYIEQGRLKNFIKRKSEFVDVILMYKECP